MEDAEFYKNSRNMQYFYSKKENTIAIYEKMNFSKGDKVKSIIKINYSAGNGFGAPPCSMLFLRRANALSPSA